MNINRTKLGVIVGCLIITLGFGTAIASVLPFHKTVTISSKSWECVASDTVGLEARCIAYRMVHNTLAPQ